MLPSELDRLSLETFPPIPLLSVILVRLLKNYDVTDFDSIWRTQDEIRTVVNAVLGECIWNLSYSERRMAIELELTITLDDDAISDLCCQFPITADYDGVGAKGSKFVFYL